MLKHPHFDSISHNRGVWDTSAGYIIANDYFESVQSDTDLTVGLYSNTSTFYGPTVSTSTDLTVGLYSNTSTFYGASITLELDVLLVPLLQNPMIFYGVKLANQTSFVVRTDARRNRSANLNKTFRNRVTSNARRSVNLNRSSR